LEELDEKLRAKESAGHRYAAGRRERTPEYEGAARLAREMEFEILGLALWNLC